jgi:uncharacterized membrane protein YcaP (DUF421 family)
MGIVLRTALMYLVVLILLRITTRRIMRSYQTSLSATHDG